MIVIVISCINYLVSAPTAIHPEKYLIQAKVVLIYKLTWGEKHIMIKYSLFITEKI